MDTPANIARAATDLVSHSIGKVAVSLGANGALFVTAGRILYAHGLAVPIKSTIGAGDAMMAALPLGNDRGDDWLNTVKKASAVGSASVMTAGTETVPPDAVQELESRVIVEELPLA